MITLWVIGSLILHLLTFYIIIHLFQRLGSVQKVDRDQIIQDIEEVFTAYLTDIQEENNRLADELKAFSGSDRSTRPAGAEEGKSIVQSPDHHLEELKGEGVIDKKNQTLAKKAAPVLPKTSGGNPRETEKQNMEKTWMPPIDDVQDTFEESLLSKAVKLQKKGYNVTEIAKTLDRGKGEIELLLKFNEKVTH